MATPKGWPTQEKEDRFGGGEFATVEPVRTKQHGLSVLAHQYVTNIGSDACEAGCTVTTIAATGHSAQKGDVISFTSGNLNRLEYKVWSVETDEITIAEKMPEAPANADTFDILRHKYPRVNSVGVPSISIAPLAIVDFIDTSVGPVIDTASDTIEGNSGTYLTIVASLNADVTKIRVADTTGRFIGLYSDPTGTPVLEAIINPGLDDYIEVSLTSGDELGVRAIDNATDITVGELCLQFLG
jgi:hypothetical protein